MMIFTMMMILVNILIMILIMMILAIVTRPRARLTPHVPVNYPNSLQVSTHRRKNRTKKQRRALEITFIHCPAFAILSTALECTASTFEGGLVLPAWFHCKPRIALCGPACDNSALNFTRLQCIFYRGSAVRADTV